ncbi:hypothetical protein GE061_005090 [Apolygus lucorum]|uniref:Uncharacterized protein n=1 Tax=Apolygus lucorum TaxID=248454 RepID=A0A6A4IUR8_APOLU|nr:hypothetical protein GE061_005090 [Apolygus lucorum]
MPFLPMCTPPQPQVIQYQQAAICNLMPQLPRCVYPNQQEPNIRQENPQFWWITVQNQVCNPPLTCKCYLGVPTNNQGRPVYTCGQ